MKLFRKKFLATALTLAVATGAMCAEQDKDVLYKVDPFWGSNVGNVIPGVSVPWGLVKLSPDVKEISTPTSGYQDCYNIVGFSHTHSNGIGGSPRYGNVLVIPQADSLDIATYRVYYDKNESAMPGYYSVEINDLNNGIRSELTASDKVGFHRYHFFHNNDANTFEKYDIVSQPVPYFVIDVSASNRKIKKGKATTYCRYGEVKIVDDHTIEGHANLIGGWGGDNPFDIYFTMTFDHPFKDYGVYCRGEKFPGQKEFTFKNQTNDEERFGAYVEFDKKYANEIQVKTGISFKNADKARQNLMEQEGIDFDMARHNAEDKWVEKLSRIRVKGGDLSAQRNFYSGLRSTIIMPTDVTGDVKGWDEDHFWDIFCIWDTYRTVTPLYCLVYPETQRKYVNTLLDIYDKRGYMPDAWIAGEFAQVQGGTNADVVIADAVVKNLGGFDVKKALEACIKNAEVQSDNPHIKGRYADDYNKYGYLTKDTKLNCVSRSLEYAYNDFCIAQVAEALGNELERDKYAKRSQQIFKLFHPKHKMFWGKDSAGNWYEPFYAFPIMPDIWNDPYFYESGAMIYSGYAPHDVARLIEHHGDKEAFKKYLDTVFDSGAFHITNEFEFLVPYLYNYIGDYASTARRVGYATKSNFRTGRNGLPGQDDSGSLSAWYIFSAMGFMPVAGQDVYLLGTPQFEETEIDLENGKKFIIKANNLSSKNIYITSATLNGRPLDRAWFRHSEIIEGAELILEMGNTPSEFGTRNVPPSLSTDHAANAAVKKKL